MIKPMSDNEKPRKPQILLDMKGRPVNDEKLPLRARVAAIAGAAIIAWAGLYFAAAFVAAAFQ